MAIGQASFYNGHGYIYFNYGTMLIRKNTRAFKTIREIVDVCRDRADREQLIRLYITKAGDTVPDRISVEAIQGEAKLFYEMNYQTVLGNLKSSTHQLHQSDEIPGIYYFHSTSNKVWDETPFEFDVAVKKEFSALPELPVLRKKEKAEKFVIPLATTRPHTRASGKQTVHTKKEKGGKQKTARVVELWPKQPDYKLKHEIHFTGLERIVFRESQLKKRNVLDYHNKIADHLLPYLKDRPLVIRLQREGQSGPPIATLQALVQNSAEEIPGWIRTTAARGDKRQEPLLLCNDREHLLFYVQIGCLEFNSCHSQVQSLDCPDYLIVRIESPDYELAKVADVAHAVKEVLTSLKLPSFPKTDGASGLDIYVPLDSKNNFKRSQRAAEYLCKLVRLKIPDVVTLKGSDDRAYNKVSLDYLVNAPGKGIAAPYSMAAQSANVATPLLWEEVNETLKAEAFNYESIFKRLKEKGDPFKGLFRKKVNADALLGRMEENYSFLF